jgi:hypothetical protein
MMSLLFSIGEDHMKGRRKGWYKFEKKRIPTYMIPS